jgi:peptidoglycan/xylan/chitin deacetylase (PgdA/CDA1 family)
MQILTKRLIFTTSKILAYHSINPRRIDNLAVDPQEFYRQMKWLAELGWKGVSLNEFVRCTFQPNGKHANLFAITFDDGFADTLLYALPILKEFNFNATIFLIVDDVGTKTIHKKQWLSQYPNVGSSDYRYLDWREVDKLLKEGIEIGAHTCTHPLLDEVSYQVQFEEIALSRIKLEKKIGHPILSFCYPDGRYNNQVLDLVKASGYQQAVVTPYNISSFVQKDIYQLRRIGIYRSDNLLRFQFKCTPGFDIIRMLRR